MDFPASKNSLLKHDIEAKLVHTQKMLHVWTYLCPSVSVYDFYLTKKTQASAAHPTIQKDVFYQLEGAAWKVDIVLVEI